MPYILYSIYLKFLWTFNNIYFNIERGKHMERIQIENKTTIRGETNNKVVSGEMTIEIAERKKWNIK